MCTMPAAPGEEYSRLAGRVATADDDDFLAFAELRFQMRGGVVDARADKTRKVVDRELAVLRARRDDDGAACTTRPSESSRLYGRRSHRRRSARQATFTFAPNFWACTNARPASAAPEIPVGKPR